MLVPKRVSIGIPTINRSQLAIRSIRSALSQTYPDVEVIVSDDASTDDTVARLREIHDSRLVVFEQKQRLGLVANFDFCLRHATGEFFLLLGDDDMLLPSAIGSLVEPFLGPKGESVGVAWCPCQIVDSDGTPLWATECGPRIEPAASMLSALFAGNRGPRLSGILLRTQDAIEVGSYELKYGDLCDIGNWGSVALLHDSVVCIDQPLVRYSQHHGSTTSQSKVEQWQAWARIVHTNLMARARTTRDPNAERQIASSRRSLISGITLTILIQTIGKPGWIRAAARQAVRTPGAIFTPYMLRRFFKDGRKLFLRGSR